MRTHLSSPRQRAIAAYVIAQALILFGAACIGWTDSLIPMALCASAAIMLTAPLILHLRRQHTRSRR